MELSKNEIKILKAASTDGPYKSESISCFTNIPQEEVDEYINSLVRASLLSIDYDKGNDPYYFFTSVKGKTLLADYESNVWSKIWSELRIHLFYPAVIAFITFWIGFWLGHVTK